MEIKNRLFPYPVLCGDTDDYGPHTEFALEPKLVDSRHELILKYDFIVKSNCVRIEIIPTDSKIYEITNFAYPFFILS